LQQGLNKNFFQDRTVFTTQITMNEVHVDDVYFTQARKPQVIRITEK